MRTGRSIAAETITNELNLIDEVMTLLQPLRPYMISLGLEGAEDGKSKIEGT